MIKKILSLLNFNTIIGIIVVFAIGYGAFLFNQNITLKKDNKRISTNFENSQFKIDSLITNDSIKSYFVKGLTVKLDELENFNSKVLNEMKALGIKIKEIESVTTINNSYNYFIDSLGSTKISNYKWKVNYADNWLNLNQNVLFDTNYNTLYIDSLNLSLKDRLLISNKIDYKRSWIFWKKPVGISIYVNSKNPYFKVNEIQYYKFIK